MDLKQVFLDLTSPTTSTEKKQEHILNITESRLKQLLNVDIVPEQLQHIVLEVSIKRYNRLTTEGMSAISQGNLSETFNNNDFDEFKDEIASWIEKNTPNELDYWVVYKA